MNIMQWIKSEHCSATWFLCGGELEPLEELEEE